MTDLEIALKSVGFAVALLGACAAVPAASWRLIERLGKRLTSVINRLLRRQVRAVIHAGSASGTLTVTGRALGLAIPSTEGTLKGRLARVELRLGVIDERLQQAAVQLTQEVDDRTRADRELREHFTAEIARIDRALDEQQRVAEEVDARALPVVLGGALLSTFPELLVANVVVGTLVLCVGEGLFFRAWALLDAARPSRRLHVPR